MLYVKIIVREFKSRAIGLWSTKDGGRIAGRDVGVWEWGALWKKDKVGITQWLNRLMKADFLSSESAQCMVFD